MQNLFNRIILHTLSPGDPECDPRNYILQNLSKSYFNPRFFIKQTKYVLENYDLDLVPCKKAAFLVFPQPDVKVRGFLTFERKLCGNENKPMAQVYIFFDFFYRNLLQMRF